MPVLNYMFSLVKSTYKIVNMHFCSQRANLQHNYFGKEIQNGEGTLLH